MYLQWRQIVAKTQLTLKTLLMTNFQLYFGQRPNAHGWMVDLS